MGPGAEIPSAVTDWAERELYEQAIDGIDRWARYDWQNRDGEARLRTILLGLRSRGLLDGKALMADMKQRGHDGRALKLLNQLIEKAYREAGLDADLPG